MNYDALAPPFPSLLFSLPLLISCSPLHAVPPPLTCHPVPFLLSLPFSPCSTVSVAHSLPAATPKAASIPKHVL